MLSKKQEKYLNLENSITKYKEKHGIEVIILNDIQLDAYYEQITDQESIKETDKVN